MSQLEQQWPRTLQVSSHLLCHVVRIGIISCRKGKKGSDNLWKSVCTPTSLRIISFTIASPQNPHSWCLCFLKASLGTAAGKTASLLLHHRHHYWRWLLDSVQACYHTQSWINRMTLLGLPPKLNHFEKGQSYLEWLAFWEVVHCDIQRKKNEFIVLN